MGGVRWWGLGSGCVLVGTVAPLQLGIKTWIKPFCCEMHLVHCRLACACVLRHGSSEDREGI